MANAFDEIIDRLPDERGKWSDSNFSFFSQIAAEMNRVCFDWEISYVTLETMLMNLPKGGLNPASDAQLQGARMRHAAKIRQARCELLSAIKSAVESNRDGSGGYGETVRVCRRSRKGSSDCFPVD